MPSLIQPYAQQHKDTKGPGDERPTAQQVVEDQGLNGKLQGKIILITGCSSGIGVETAKALYSTGATIYITGRNIPKTEGIAKSIATDSTRPVKVVEVELDSFASVKAGAADFLKKSGNKLNILICNAGVMAAPEGRTKDGFETQFGTNHLGHFLLFQLLKPALLAATTPDFNSRVISLSSSGHRMGGIHFGNINLTEKSDPYDPWKAYGQAKTANIYFANEIDRRYGSKHLHALSLHPGVIQTELGRHVADDPLMKEIGSDPEMQKLSKSIPQGAATSVWAAIGKEWEGKGGRFLSDVAEDGPVAPNANMVAAGYAPHAYDTEAAKRLWIESLDMVGMKDDE